MVQNSKKSYYSTDDGKFFNFCAFNFSVKSHDFICRPRRSRVAAEILIKINKHTYPRIYDFPYILPQIKPTLKGPKTMVFSKYFSDYNTSSRCIYQNVLIELCSIRMPQIS